MKQVVFYSLILWSLGLTGQHLVQVKTLRLASPEVIIDSIFFENTATVQIFKYQEGVVFRYTDDSTQPDGKSTMYLRPFPLTKSTLIRAKAYHPDFLESEESTLNLFRIDADADFAIRSSAEPAGQYGGKGLRTLTDRSKGSMNFRDGAWLGFDQDSLHFTLDFATPINNPTLGISLMVDHGSWIFAPGKITVKGSRFDITWSDDVAQENVPRSFRYVQIPIEEQRISSIEILVEMDAIPSWHPGAGTTPWLFIDEIFFLDKNDD